MKKFREQTPPPYLGNIKKKHFFSASLNSSLWRILSFLFRQIKSTPLNFVEEIKKGEFDRKKTVKGSPQKKAVFLGNGPKS